MRASATDARRQWCVFTSAGDHNNVASWVSNLPGRDWDLIVAFFGEDERAYQDLIKISSTCVRMKGSKFQNLKKLVERQPGIFANYDFVWVADDDLIISPPEIETLFRYACCYDLWVCQPAFDKTGRVSHPVTVPDGKDVDLRFVNFVEVTCPLFRKDKLDSFLSVYDGDLVGWGIDWWYSTHLNADRCRKFAVIDRVLVRNPHEQERPGGNRAITKLQSDEQRKANWLDTASRLHLSEYEPRTLAHVSDALRNSGTSKVISDLLRDLPKKPFRTLFDIGAHIGESTEVYARLLQECEIFCFEPAPDAFAKLEDTVSSIPKAHAYNLGLSDSPGERLLKINPNSTMSRLSAKGGEEIMVPVATLAEFCQNNNIPHIDFVKIDTEGHDLEVLKGAAYFLENIDILQCEVSANRYNRFHAFFEDICNYMFDAGFYLYHIYEQTPEWTGGGYPIMRRFDPVFINSNLVGPIQNVVDH